MRRYLLVIAVVLLAMLIFGCTSTSTSNSGYQTGTGAQQGGIKQKVRSAALSIDKVQITLANLYPTRITVTNNGDVAIYPKFDVYVYDANGKEVCSGSPLFDQFDSIAPNEKQTGEITLTGCMFKKDGTYTLKVDLLDSDYTKLDSKIKDFTVDYWSKLMP